jgi:hypothetical protein
MPALSDRMLTLFVIPALAMSAVASARTVGTNPEPAIMTLAVLSLQENGLPVHTNFGPYDVEIDGMTQGGFHFNLEMAEASIWIANCAIGDDERLLCSFYDPAGDAHGFLAVDGREDGLGTGVLQGPGVHAIVERDWSGWRVVQGETELAGVQLRGRNKVWFDVSTELAIRPLLAAAAGALLVFDEVKN